MVVMPIKIVRNCSNTCDLLVESKRLIALAAVMACSARYEENVDTAIVSNITYGDKNILFVVLVKFCK